MQIYLKKRAAFPSSQLLPPQHTPVLAPWDRGEGNPTVRASELSGLERTGEKEDPLLALGHTFGKLLELLPAGVLVTLPAD